MFDIMKAVRETDAARSAVTRARRPRPELIRLRVEIERTKCAIEAARNHFEQAVGDGAPSGSPAARVRSPR